MIKISYLRRALNKLTIKHKPYPKSTKIDAFDQKNMHFS